MNFMKYEESLFFLGDHADCLFIRADVQIKLCLIKYINKLGSICPIIYDKKFDETII